MDVGLLRNNFRFYLQRELAQRKIENPRYSLRQFARVLSIEPSFLSKVLRGERSITMAFLQMAGKRLNLSYQEIEAFKVGIFKSLERPGKSKTRAAIKNKFNPFLFESISLMSGWYYFAILEMLSLPDLQLTPKQMARSLKISESEMGVAIERLEELQLIVRDETGKFRIKEKNNTIPQKPFSTAELRSIQKQFQIKAIESLENDPLDERDHSGMTLAVSSSQIPLAKKMITTFRRKFMREMQKVNDHDRIYQLSVCFYPLSTVIRNHRENEK